MAIFGFERLLVPQQRMHEVAALLEQHGISLHRLHDVTEGGDVHVLRFTGRRVADKPLHGL